MTPEEQRRIAAERKRNYRLRKKNEELARQAPKEVQERLFNEQAHNIAPELEEDHREQAGAVLSEAEERSRRLDLIMANHNRIRSNPSELMWEILKLLNLMRMELTDLIGNK